jgi:hypothetical protein
MSTATKTCACGCNPCICITFTDTGCLPSACVPRPCFFDGQLIGADDLNAIVAYFRNQQAMVNRLVGGWGILGGLKLDAPAGYVAANRAKSLASGAMLELSPNPQIIAGTMITVSAGAAIDALGRTLFLCEPVTLNVQDLARDATGGALQVGNCAELIGPYCEGRVMEDILVSEFFLIAERVETPFRPAPKFSGGGACDPAPSCELSRKLEEIRFSLVASIPELYQFTGCLENTDFVAPDAIPGTAADPSLCRDEVFAYIDAMQQRLAEICCARPAVVLGKVLFTRDPRSLGDDLASAPLYTILLDGYPCRKVTMQMGVFTKLFPNMICCATPAPPPPPIDE